MQIKYKELFDLEVLHSFYSSGKCPDIDLIPTIDCQVLLKQLGFVFIATNYGGKLFAKVKTTAGKDIIENPISEGTKFTFKLKLKRHEFENYTFISLDKPKGSHYYFNNLTENISAENFPLLVTNTTSKSVSDTDLLTFVSNIFSFNHTSASRSLQGELRFIDSGESFAEELNSENNIFNFSYDLNKTPGGRAQFLIEGSEVQSFYAIKPEEYADTFGIVEIFYKNSLPTAYQFQQPDNSIETKFYQIPFSNRSTNWRYIISKKFNKSVSEVKVAKTNGSTISFTAKTDSPPDQFVLVSNTPIPLIEEPVTGIKLSDQADKVLITNLPNPALNLVRVEESKTFSDILITI